ncbi:MAG: toprim domain-containing protein, partial [Achromobacter sp.]|uniref:toprim domain-containing protein n=1 Tax=Achromobacter sp. TaxID=134375 RepID=UPI002585D948
NDERVPAANFADYVGLYDLAESKGTGTADEVPRIWERLSDRWEVCMTLSDGVFGQVSFVNAIATYKGGTHVAYLADQIAGAVAEAANKKSKGVDVKPAHVRNYMTLFVNCLVENPSFDSQTKETLTTRPKDFGSTPVLSDAFIKAALGSGIVERVQSWARYKATAELQRAAGGKRMARFVGIAKLDDANHAGTAKGGDCTLILTEGDSAKSLAIAGLSVVGRDYYGVFPLRGKPLNVREAAHKQIMANAEIQAVVTIMGLQYGKVYDSVKGLRYGHLMIMADQDADGSHIKGLILNFLHHFWPSLLAVPGFLREFITPIVKVTPKAGPRAGRDRAEKSFYTLPDYLTWKAGVVAAAGGGAGGGGGGGGGKAAAAALAGWQLKYYKGLGTSTSAEAKEYFAAIGRHQIDFALDDAAVTGEDAADLIDMAFSKKRADDRKRWLGGFVDGTRVDLNTDRLYVSDFIN